MSIGDTINILLVDDDEAERLAVRRALRAGGLSAQMIEVSNAADALAVLRATPFDCVLMDYGLSDRDGLSLLQEVRAAGVRSPVIMLTGQGDEQLAVDVMKAGASDYLSKSRVSLERLMRSIQSAIRLHRAEEQAEAAIRKVTESEERYRSLVFATAQIVWSTDASGLATDLPYWCAFTGQSQEQANGFGWSDAVHPDDRAAAREGWAKANQVHSNYEIVYRLRRHDGVYRHVITRGTPVIGSDGVIREWVGTCTDITERVEAERERSLLLAKEQAARAEAEAANRAKDQFLAVLSHELRTPLTPVLTTVQDLEGDTRLPPDTRSVLRMVRRNVELEARLIDDLLDLTRISKGKLQLVLGTADAHLLINSVLEICEADIISKQQQIKVELGASRRHVRADSARLQQVLWNLIKNAVKFTPEEGRIVVSTRNDTDGNLELQVSDTGIGIEADAMPRIFDAFEQGEQSVTRQFGGLGLGLTITRALVEAHGGKISATSEGRHAGTTFRLTLPTTEAVAEPPPKALTPPTDDLRTPMSILLVDDHADTTRAMKRLLERIGYDVRTASSVAGALESASTAPFDLLISDIGLPDGSGMDLVRQLKQSLQNGVPLKAIAISGFGMEEDLSKSREAGFIEHLTKPVNFHVLEEIIQRVRGGRD